METQWKDIPDYEGIYQVSNFGQVRRMRGHYGKQTAGILKPQDDGKGYMRVRLYKKGNWKMFRVHQVVMRAFIGEYPPGKEINHLDGNRANNHLDNLSYVTKSENCLHMYRVLGTRPKRAKGESTGSAKLREEEVIEIRRLYATGKHSQRKLASIFGMSQGAIGPILRGETWKHLL